MFDLSVRSGRLVQRVRWAASMMVFVGVGIVQDVPIRAQFNQYYPVEPISTPAPVGVIHWPTGTPTCTLPNGGYININTIVTLHASVTIEGACAHYYSNPPIFHDNHLRYLNTIQVNEPGQGSSNFPVNSGQQTYDSQTDGYAGGLGKGTGPTVGTKLFTMKTIAMLSSCGIPITNDPGSILPMSMNVMSCEPKFWTKHLPPSPIVLYLPTPSMDDALTALTAAKNSWNAAIAGTGRPELTIERTACDPALGTCVTIGAVDHGGCGWADGSINESTGEIVGDAILELHPDWNDPIEGFTASGLERTFAHELGHLLGLDNYATTPPPNPVKCATNNAVMEPNFLCKGTPTLVAPTFNDSRPVGNSVYDGNTKSTCGF